MQNDLSLYLLPGNEHGVLFTAEQVAEMEKFKQTINEIITNAISSKDLIDGLQKLSDTAWRRHKELHAHRQYDDETVEYEKYSVSQEIAWAASSGATLWNNPEFLACSIKNQIRHFPNRGYIEVLKAVVAKAVELAARENSVAAKHIDL